ncbi:LytTR family DNA-binding domain-containing protein [Nesterenkonia sp. HG001]|uniref:LytR/AlgR family response regulator transcription factor n=1 Tax=Nesterenkonia sp. HG001 TaxID=2983207 RepID=UPI002AC5B51E|nr:LytTR family DNA-binding domain-containing protein [Nesterenkonia sp. HG001]MDZ5076167.1 LytTR family DNA-binding domain-containing protein [Nesterenkonia sp. HG001]
MSVSASTPRASQSTAAPTGRALRVLVVDDEPPAVAQMHWLLEADPQVGAVCTASNVAQARHQLDTREVDVILLDVHMPGPSGLAMARELRTSGEQWPQIIFVTADAGPAVEAFELAARDYLLKPVRAARLSEALRRAAEVLGGAADAGEGEPQRVSVLQGDATVLVDIASIRWVQAQGDYARLHTEAGSYLLRIALGDLEEQWSRQGFVRVHRSSAVNLHHVHRVVHRQGRMTVQLRDGSGGAQEIAVSRRLMHHVRERLEVHRVRSPSGGGSG